MAKSNAARERSIPAGEIAAHPYKETAHCPLATAHCGVAGGGFDSVEYSGGAGKDIDERIRAVPVDSAGSKAELQTQLLICADLGYLADMDIKEAIELSEEVGKMLVALIRKLPTAH